MLFMCQSLEAPKPLRFARSFPSPVLCVFAPGYWFGKFILLDLVNDGRRAAAASSSCLQILTAAFPSWWFLSWHKELVVFWRLASCGV